MHALPDGEGVAEKRVPVRAVLLGAAQAQAPVDGRRPQVQLVDAAAVEGQRGNLGFPEGNPFREFAVVQKDARGDLGRVQVEPTPDGGSPQVQVR